MSVFRFLVLAILPFLVVSCAGSPAWSSMQISSTRGTADRNNQNMLKLKIGMPKDDVISVMGNPEKTESYDLGKGMIVEFYFYRTQGWSGDEITDSDRQFTPLAFQNDKLIGWGRNYYDRVIRHQLDVKVSDSRFGSIPAFEAKSE